MYCLTHLRKRNKSCNFQTGIWIYEKCHREIILCDHCACYLKYLALHRYAFELTLSIKTGRDGTVSWALEFALFSY